MGMRAHGVGGYGPVGPNTAATSRLWKAGVSTLSFIETFAHETQAIAGKLSFIFGLELVGKTFTTSVHNPSFHDYGFSWVSIIQLLHTCAWPTGLRGQ